jgi:hypothetical protein
MEPALETELSQTFSELIDEFSSIPEEAINIVPFEGSWTAGQLAEHIFKSTARLPEMLNQESEPTNRPPDEKVERIKSIFLDFSKKMQAPPSVLPAAAPHEKATLLHGFQETKLALIQAARELDLTEICKVYEFPTLGYFTRLEWLTFSVVHTKRHVEQLKRIHQALALKI